MCNITGIEEKPLEEPDVIARIINEEIGFGPFQLRLALLCCFGYFAVGSELFSMVMTQQDVETAFGLSAGSFTWLPFCANLASFLAAIIVGTIVDKFGRSWAFQTCIMMSAILGIACAFAPNFPCLVFFRSVVGFGLGGMTVIDYIVLVEVCPDKWKNIACQTVFVSGCLGVVYVGLISLVDWSVMDLPSWRCMLFTGALPLLVTGVLRVFIAIDTPKYLVLVGRRDQAYTLLSTMAKKNSRNSLTVTRDSFIALTQNLSFQERAQRGKVRDVFQVKGTLDLAGLWMIQSMVYWGLTLILPLFFKFANIASTTSLLCMGFAELPGVGIATLISQRVSRPVSLLVCIGLSLIGSILAGLAFLYNWHSVLIFAMCVFYMFLVPIWGILFIHTPELYPVQLRGVAVGFHHMVKSAPSLAAPFIGSAIMHSEYRYYVMFVWSGCLVIAMALGIRLNRV
jgi:putative MFS transporter